MYQERLLAFIDILGFSAAINNTVQSIEGKKREIKDETQKIYCFFEEAQSLLDKKYPDRTKSENIRVVNHFSDSIVISYSMAEEAAIFSILTEILFLCVTALQKNFLLRGAVVCNKLYHEDNIIFGPALVKASDMEKKLAIYPRIVLNDDILDIVDKHQSKWPSKTTQAQFKKNILTKDFDGLYYVNYVDGINFVINDKDGILVYFKSLRTSIIKLERFIKEDMSIKSKYLWLKTKYNITLQKYKKKYCNAESKSSELYEYLSKLESL